MDATDHTQILTNDALLHLLERLDPVSVCQTAQVSRRFRDLAENAPVWKHLAEARGYEWNHPHLAATSYRDRFRILYAKEQTELIKAQAVQELFMSCSVVIGNEA